MGSRAGFLFSFVPLEGGAKHLVRLKIKTGGCRAFRPQACEAGTETEQLAEIASLSSPTQKRSSWETVYYSHSGSVQSAF